MHTVVNYIPLLTKTALFTGNVAVWVQCGFRNIAEWNVLEVKRQFMYIVDAEGCVYNYILGPVHS